MRAEAARSACGNDCRDCPAYFIPGHGDEPAFQRLLYDAWRRAMGRDFPFEAFRCGGCGSEEPFFACGACDMRASALAGGKPEEKRIASYRSWIEANKRRYFWGARPVSSVAVLESRPASEGEMQRFSFRDALRDAVYKPDDAKLDRIHDAYAGGREGRAFGFFQNGTLLGAACAGEARGGESGGDLPAGAVEIRYIGTAAGYRGLGIGGRLVGAVRQAHGGRPVAAWTDGDAVGFYAKAGFSIERRMVERHDALKGPIRFERYLCVLA